jgi:hypothetical protein
MPPRRLSTNNCTCPITFAAVASSTLVHWLHCATCACSVAEAAAALGGHIQDFLARRGDGNTSSSLPPDLVRQWLSAVVLAWREYVQAHLPERLEMALNRLNGGLL